MPTNQEFNATRFETTARSAKEAEGEIPARPARIDMICVDDVGNRLRVTVDRAVFDNEIARHIESLLDARLLGANEVLKDTKQTIEKSLGEIETALSQALTGIRNAAGVKRIRATKETTEEAPEQ